MLVYKQEKADGLEEIIQSNAAIAFECEVQPFSSAELDSFISLAKANDKNVETKIQHMNLYPLKSLFVTAGIWNKNQDVFDKLEVWQARATPEDQPINKQHDQTKIIGHITDTYPVNEKLERLANDLCADELPDKFHLITAGVIYKYWQDNEDLQKEVNALIKAIAEKKVSVSMEVLFRGFDYAIIDPNGNSHILARSEESSFLTKHLKAYGGTGKYQNHQIGRLMRNMSFSGKGIVDKPANPDSVIFSSGQDFSGTKKEISQVLKDTVYMSKSSKTNAEESNKVNELEILKEQLVKKDAELAKASAALKELDSKKFDELQVQVKASADQVASLNDKVKSLEASKAEVEKKLASTQAEASKQAEQLDLANKAIEAAKLEKVKAERIVALTEAVGDKAEAELLFDNLSLELATDEKFKSVAEYLKKKAVAGDEGTAQGGGKESKKPVKTMVVAGKKSAGTPTITTAEELEDAEVEETVALNSNDESGNEKVEKTRADISSFLSKNYLRSGRKPAENKE